MRRITSRIRAAIGAAMIVACATPVAAHAQRPPARMRVQAQWVERRGAARQLVPWRMARRPVLAAAWRRGYGRGFAVGRYPLRAAAWRRAWYRRGFARGRLYGRYWERRGMGRMGGRWSL